MPRGRKPPSIKRKPDSTAVTVFMGRIENAAPEWLDGFLERQRVLIERFHEKDDEGKYVASPETQARIHEVLTKSESGMLRFAALREQHLKELGLSAYVEREGSTTTNILNFAPGMTPEQRAYAERLFLASVSGKEVTAPTLELPAVAEAVRESA